MAYIELRAATKRIDALLLDAPQEIAQTEWRDTIRDANCSRPGVRESVRRVGRQTPAA